MHQATLDALEEYLNPIPLTEEENRENAFYDMHYDRPVNERRAPPQYYKEQ